MQVLKSILTLLFCLPCIAAFAQDVLVKRDGTRDTVKIIEVSEKQVTYKKFNKPKGPEYVINKTGIVQIEFGDGRVQVMSDTDKDAAEQRPNIISTNILALPFGNVYLNYERILPGGVVGIRPVAQFHFFDVENNLSMYTKLNNYGIDFNFYPVQHNKLRYYLGPGIRMGTWRERRVTSSITIEQIYLAQSLYLNNGFVIQPTGEFYLGLQCAFGFTRLVNKNISSLRIESYNLNVLLAINAGYRF